MDYLLHIDSNSYTILGNQSYSSLRPKEFVVNQRNPQI